MYVRLCVHPVVTFIAPPENITVCRGNDVNISCGYLWRRGLPTKWIINGTMFSQQELMDSPLYHLNNPTSPMTYSLTLFSISSSTTFQCVVHSTPTTTSSLGTVTVNGMYVRLNQYVCAHTHLRMYIYFKCISTYVLVFIVM